MRTHIISTNANARLREERNRKGWTVQDVTQKLKLKEEQYIISLEEAYYFLLPHDTFTLGLTRRYCDLLTFNEEERDRIIVQVKNTLRDTQKSSLKSYTPKNSVRQVLLDCVVVGGLLLGIGMVGFLVTAPIFDTQNSLQATQDSDQ